MNLEGGLGMTERDAAGEEGASAEITDEADALIREIDKLQQKYQEQVDKDLETYQSWPARVPDIPITVQSSRVDWTHRPTGFGVIKCNTQVKRIIPAGLTPRPNARVWMLAGVFVASPDFAGLAGEPEYTGVILTRRPWLSHQLPYTCSLSVAYSVCK